MVTMGRYGFHFGPELRAVVSTHGYFEVYRPPYDQDRIVVWEGPTSEIGVPYYPTDQCHPDCFAGNAEGATDELDERFADWYVLRAHLLFAMQREGLIDRGTYQQWVCAPVATNA